MIRIFHHYVSKMAFMLLLLELLILLAAAVAAVGAFLPALAFALVQIFCMSTLGMYLMVAMGQVKPQAAVDVQATLVRGGAVLVAAPFGLYWVAWAIVAGALFRCAISYRWLRALIGLRLTDLLMALWRSALVTLACLLGPVSAQWLGAPAAIWHLIFAGCLAALLWLGAMVTLRHELAVQIWRRR